MSAALCQMLLEACKVLYHLILVSSVAWLFGVIFLLVIIIRYRNKHIITKGGLQERSVNCTVS